MKLGELAQRLGGREVDGDPDFEVVGVASPDAGGPQDLGFLRSAANAALLEGSALGAVIAPAGAPVGDRPVLRSPHPNLDFARAAGLLAGREKPAPVAMTMGHDSIPVSMRHSLSPNALGLNSSVNCRDAPAGNAKLRSSSRKT